MVATNQSKINLASSTKTSVTGKQSTSDHHQPHPRHQAIDLTNRHDDLQQGYNDTHTQQQHQNQEKKIQYSQYPKIDLAISNMKQSLGRFTRANDRRMVLRTLKDVKYLKAMPIAESRDPPLVTLEELEREVAQHSYVLNGQAFHQKTQFGRTSTDFMHVLHKLCDAICETTDARGNNGPNNVNSNSSSIMPTTMSPDTLYYDLLCRLARTILSADCFAKLNDILGSSDLILMNASAERKPKHAPKKANARGHLIRDNNNNNSSEIPPTEINLFEEGGNIHAQIVTTLGYGLYRKLDANTGRPWIKLKAELNERMNFTTNARVRHVTVHWPDMYV